MDWSSLGSLFCLELSLGTFVFLGLVSKAPVTPFFFRMNGFFGLLLLGAAWWLRFAKQLPEGVAGQLLILGTALGVGGYLGSVFRTRAQIRRIFLLSAILGAALALAGAVRSMSNVDAGVLSLFLLSAAASGMIVGGIGISMALGHHYLTVPDMEIAHLKRLNVATIFAIVAKIAGVGVLLAIFSSQLIQEESALFRPMGWFHLGTRFFVGLVMPLVFALMVVGCLKHNATRSATGILYASTVLVILGEAMGLSLWSSYGVML